MIRWRLLPALRTILLGLTLVVAMRMFWIPVLPRPLLTLEDGGDPSSSSMAPLNSEMEPVIRKTRVAMESTTYFAFRHPNFRVDFPLCLVHIGKAAGSSVSCGLGLMYADCEGMPRDPRLPHTHFFHMRRNNCPRGNQNQNQNQTRTYLVTLRNPLTRLQSWFDFEKDIVPMRGKTSKAQIEKTRNQRAMLFQDCYPTFERFVMEGLVPLSPRIKLQNETTATASSLQEMTCPERAWAAVLGVRAFSYHEWYNYEYYWTGIQIQPKGGLSNNGTVGVVEAPMSLLPPASVVYALRTEHLQQDWKTVSKEPLFRPVNRRKQESSTSNTTHTKKKHSKTFLLDEHRAREQLCHALCPEIQFYKQFLRFSTNLSPAQQNESLKEVQDYCPLESSLQPRDCPGIPSFPKMTVTARQYRTEIKKRLYQVSSTGNDGLAPT